MKLREFDLNLLVIFDGLMRERNVSNTAKALFLSQSAVSHSLNRLRDKLNDPLLVASKGGMRPTPRALVLEPVVREWLALIEQNLVAPPDFDPATSTERFVLAATDYVEYAFLPLLMRRLALEAPNINIRLKRVEQSQLQQAMAQGEIDAAIYLFESESIRDCKVEKIASEEPVVLLRRDHPRVLGHELTLEQYLAESHLVIDRIELSQEVDVILAEQKQQRRIRLQVPNCLAAPIILADSDMLATVPTYIARRFIQGGRLKIASLPLQLGYFPVMLCWHKFRDQDPAQQWFRQQLSSIGQQLVEQRRVEGRDDELC